MGVGIGTASASRDHMQESRSRREDGEPGSHLPSLRACGMQQRFPVAVVGRCEDHQKNLIWSEILGLQR